MVQTNLYSLPASVVRLCYNSGIIEETDIIPYITMNNAIAAVLLKGVRTNLYTVKPAANPKEDKKIGFQDQLSINAGHKYCRILQESILQYFLTFIKLPFVFKTFVLSIFEWTLRKGFTIVYLHLLSGSAIIVGS